MIDYDELLRRLASACQQPIPSCFAIRDAIDAIHELQFTVKERDKTITQLMGGARRDIDTSSNFDADGEARMATEEERQKFNVDVDGRLILWSGARVIRGSDQSNW